MPMDRRQALANGRTLPDRTTGTALLADISGFTHLTEGLVQALGPQRGAEELTRVLNLVFEALIVEVDRYGGSVVGFSGDALTGWFDGDAGLRAATCALALQRAMAAFHALPLPTGETVALALKCAVVAGPVRRFSVGDPQYGLLDVLAGPTLERLGVTEELAAPGEVLVDEVAMATMEEAGPAGTWRADPESGARLFALTGVAGPAAPDPWPALEPGSLPPEQVQPWLLPAVRARWEPGHSEFLAELRPAVALFLRFTGLDYERPIAGRRLDTYIRWVQSVLARYEGFLIDLTIGDKGSYLYAAFGAVVAHADDATRAVAVAVELREPPPQCSFIRGTQIGISQGGVRVGAAGGHSRRTYAVRGDAVNLAARLMQHAAPGGILVTREVRRAASSRFRWASLPPLQVKGKAVPVPVFGLVEESATSGLGLLETATGPLVGRAAELATLEARLAQAGNGRGQVVAITGEAGLGKSRLVAEVIRRAHTAGFAVFGGAAQSYGTQTAYLAWQSIWRAFFDLDPNALADEQIADLEFDLATIGPQLPERLPLLGAVLGLTIADTPLTAALEPALRKASLEALLIDCLRARAPGPHTGAAGRGAPLLLVLEDCQWLDPLSQDLLEAIGRMNWTAPVLLLLAYRPADAAAGARPGPAAPLTPLRHFTELRLAPLTAQDVGTLVAARLGATDGPSLPAGLVDQLMARAEGNPFYLEELLTYLAEQGIDPCDPTALVGLHWPASLQSVLLARLDQLTESRRTVLKVASIVGRRFRPAQLWGVYPQLGAAAQVAADLEALEHAGLILLESPAPEPHYLFKNIVTQEVTYESLPHALRLRLHEQFAGWLESGSVGAGAAAPLDLLAYHYGHSANRAKQREYFRKAGDAAALAFAHAAAQEYYTQLLDLLDQEGNRSEGAAVLLALAGVLERGGVWDAAVARYQEALGHAETLHDARLRGRAQQGLGVVRRHQGAWAEAATWLEQAQASFAALNDGPGVSHVLTELGRLYLLQGEYARARAVLGESLALQRAGDDKAALAQALNSLGAVAWRQGDTGGARALHQESLILRREIADKAGIALSLNSLGAVAINEGDFLTARALYEESLALRREVGDKAGVAIALNNLGTVALEQEDYGTARTALEESLALKRELGAKSGVAVALNNLGFVALHQGNYLMAWTRWEEGLTLCRELGDKLLTVDALVGLAALAGRQGQAARAARLLGAIAHLLATLGGTLEPLERRIYEQTEAATRTALGPDFAATWARGASLSWDAAIAVALGELC